VISRFVATTGTLTSAPLPPAQFSLVTQRTLLDIPSPTTPCAPVFRQCFLIRAGLAPDSPCRLSAVLWTSFVASSLVNRMKPNRVCVEELYCPSALRTIRLLPVALHGSFLNRSYLQSLAGSAARQGLSPCDVRCIPSALAAGIPACRGGRASCRPRKKPKKRGTLSLFHAPDLFQSSFRRARKPGSTAGKMPAATLSGGESNVYEQRPWQPTPFFRPSRWKPAGDAGSPLPSGNAREASRRCAAHGCERLRN